MIELLEFIVLFHAVIKNIIKAFNILIYIYNLLIKKKIHTRLEILCLKEHYLVSLKELIFGS